MGKREGRAGRRLRGGAVLLAAALALAGCVSPKEQCIARAGHDLRVLDQLIATTKANIRRGYALIPRTSFGSEKQKCGELNGETLYCDVPVATEIEVPVAIDMAAEKAKLASLEQTRARKLAETQAAIRQCAALE